LSFPLPAPLDEVYQKYWQRFEEAVQRNSDQAGLIEYDGLDLLSLTRQRQDLPFVWSCSDFIAQTCISRYELLGSLLHSGELDQPWNRERITRRVDEFVGLCDDEIELQSRLRRIRQRIMVLLGWRDLGGLAELEETMECVSALAEICINLALQHHDRWLSHRYGAPMDGNTGQRSELLVLGLGKLGGSELNYSSDIDLVFTYSGAGSTLVNDKVFQDNQPGKSSVLDNQEYFTRLGRKIVAALDPVTADGFVFRTDMRLRPNGDSGPLVLSFSAMEHYYQTHGRTWERYALIKARVVAGSAECGEAFLAMLRPFVYRKYLDFGAFDSIREMKGMIQRELRQAGSEQNIKLGWGGIREIEFLVQSHQLIRGGRDKRLQTCSLYSALDSLVETGVMEVAIKQELVTAYRFLRNTEHRLQMVADRQTQLLPTDDLGQMRLAVSMGFSGWEEFMEQQNRHRRSIHDQFKTILEAPGSSSGDATEDNEINVVQQWTPSLRALGDIWSGKQADDQVTASLIALGFGNAEPTPKLLSGFREGRLYQAFSGIERDRIDRLVPLALVEAAKHAESERAIASFIAILEAIGRRTAYLSLLIENPIALSQLLHLCAASPWVSRHIGQHPVILDELLNPLVDIRDRVDTDLQEELKHRLDQVEEGDEEGQLNGLREFHHAQVLRIAAADVSGVLKVEDVHRALTLLAEVLLRHVFTEAKEYAARKLPDPQCEAGVIAYGKFASSELGYHSDLDVVVCFELSPDCSPASRAEAEHFYSRVGRRFIHLLSTRTHAGQLYEIDVRLRPSGRSGTLVTSLTGFLDYQLRNAWTWEHQALVRARAVVGGSSFSKKFERVRATILNLVRDNNTLRTDITEMRTRMIEANCQSTDRVYDIKLGEGGIVDIEFLIQYWILLHARNHPALLVPRTTREAISALVDLGLIPMITGEKLLDSYRIYLRRSLDLKLMDLPVLAAQDELLSNRNDVIAVWKQTFG
jgi:glutamate-ammonia-ligase adenylyltransferase